MIKNIGRLYKYNRPKQINPTFKKPVLSSSADHASSTGNLKRTFISSKLNNKNITKNQNKNKNSNTDDIQSCVTPGEKITVFRPHLQPLV